jgi:hypothetical protein
MHPDSGGCKPYSAGGLVSGFIFFGLPLSGISLMTSMLCE